MIRFHLILAKMSIETKTKYLIYISVLGIILSFFTQKKGWGELYPFFHWKLYSQPSAKDSVYCVQRLIVVSEEGKKEIFFNNGKTVSNDDYFYVTNQLSRDFEAKHDTTLLYKRLTDWGKQLTPSATCFELVKSCCDPLVYSKGKKDFQNHLIISTCD